MCWTVFSEVLDLMEQNMFCLNGLQIFVIVFVCMYVRDEKRQWNRE